MTAANSARSSAFDMHKLSVVWLGVALLASGPAVLAAKRTTQTWIGPTRNVVLVVDAGTPMLDDALGSGVMFPGGKVLTDCHILKSVKHPGVRQGETRSNASVAYEDRGRDLCELKVDHAERFRPSSLKLRTVQDVSAGEPVYAVGGEEDGEIGVTQGQVVKVQKFWGDDVILISSRLGEGYSGGALFDREGSLIGIVTYRDRVTGKLSYAYPAQYVLLRKGSDVEQKGQPASAPERSDAASRSETQEYKRAADAYVHQLGEASMASVRYPEEARSEGWSGTASIRFELGSGGALRQSYVDVSSGYAGLDVAALLAVRKAIGDIPIPARVKEKGLKGTVAITFKLLAVEKQE